jgi:hypothetical protein
MLYYQVNKQQICFPMTRLFLFSLTGLFNSFDRNAVCSHDKNIAVIADNVWMRDLFTTVNGRSRVKSCLTLVVRNATIGQ